MVSGISFSDAVTALSDLLFPRTCPVCGRLLALRERFICTDCLADLPRTHFTAMSRNQMSSRFNALVQRDLDGLPFDRLRDRNVMPGSDRASGAPPYSYATALFFYRTSTGYPDITRHLKYHADLGLGRHFASILGRGMAGSPLFSDVDIVIPVPLHWTRRWSRGYNQAEVIASVLADCLGAALHTDILYRTRRTKTQTRLSLEEKARNVSGAFRVRRSFLRSMGRDGRSGNPAHILLVDDVFTTGATLHACYRALRTVFSVQVRISVATLACVGQ